MTSVIPDEDKVKILKMLSQKMGNDDKYPGFLPNNVVSISYTLTTGKGSTNYANSLRHFSETKAKSNLLAEAAKDRTLINITFNDSNGPQITFTNDYDKKDYSGIKMYRSQKVEGTYFMFYNNGSNLVGGIRNEFNTAVGQVIGRYVQGGLIEFPGPGGRRLSRRKRNQRRKTRRSKF